MKSTSAIHPAITENTENMARETHTPKINYWKAHKPVRFIFSYVLSVTQQYTQRATVAGSGRFSLISLVSYYFPKIYHFPTISYLISFLLPNYFPLLDYFPISRLFLEYFPNGSHFSTISPLFLAHFLTISWLLPDFPGDFPTVSQLLSSQLFEWTKPAPEPLSYELLTS